MAALAPSIEWMIVARVVQGIGGGVLPLAFGIIRDEVSPARSGTAVGLVASLLSAAFGIGIVLAGPIVDGLGYTWLFWLPAIATAFAAVGDAAVHPRVAGAGCPAASASCPRCCCRVARGAAARGDRGQ